MKIKDLIKVLEGMDPDREVYVPNEKALIDHSKVSGVKSIEVDGDYVAVICFR